MVGSLVADLEFWIAPERLICALCFLFAGRGTSSHQGIRAVFI
jgi:hypothetical protein